MSRASLAAVGILLALNAFAGDTSGPIPTEGKTQATQVTSGAVQVIPLAKDQARVSYDVMGVRLREGDLLHKSSVRCVGAMIATNGTFDDEVSNCIFTRPDGDQAFTAAKGAGKVGGEARGTWKFIGGTGKLAGIQGSGDWTRTSVRPAMQGTTQGIIETSGTYKLAAPSASR